MAGGESDDSGLVLLDVFGSPFAQRVRITLAEKGLAYERAEQDLAAKGDLLRRSNPVHGKVPVLLHAGRPICESLAILQYLDEAFRRTPPLLPADPYVCARARFWAEYADRLHLFGKRLWLRRDEEAAEPEAREEMVAVLRALDVELGGKEFWAGGIWVRGRRDGTVRGVVPHVLVPPPPPSPPPQPPILSRPKSPEAPAVAEVVPEPVSPPPPPTPPSAPAAAACLIEAPAETTAEKCGGEVAAEAEVEWRRGWADVMGC